MWKSFNEKGVQYLQEDLLELAEANFKDAIQVEESQGLHTSPQRCTSMLNLGAVYRKTQSYEQARSILEQTVSHIEWMLRTRSTQGSGVPPFTMVHLMANAHQELGTVYLIMKEYRRGIEALKSCITYMDQAKGMCEICLLCLC